MTLISSSTHSQYIEDQNVANDPWHGFEEWYLKVTFIAIVVRDFQSNMFYLKILLIPGGSQQTSKLKSH